MKAEKYWEMETLVFILSISPSVLYAHDNYYLSIIGWCSCYIHCLQITIVVLTITDTNNRSHIWKLLHSSPQSTCLMASCTPFSPFYKPGALPPPLPLLTAQTDLVDGLLRPLHLTNAEPLPRSGTAQATTSAHPCLTKVTLNHCSLPPSDSSPDSESESDLSELSDLDSPSDSGLDDVKIPKPPGEAGQPGCGGYMLEEALDWDSKSFRKLKVWSPFNYSCF